MLMQYNVNKQKALLRKKEKKSIFFLFSHI